jgi:DNA-binding LacI/PurR family transcriptional regulator
MIPTIKEIAAKAKVSIATVSRALNNDPRVAGETRKKILDLAKQLNYSPNILARNFVKKKTNILGMILPEISDEFFTEIIKGVDEVTYEKGYYTIIASSHKYESLEDEIITFIRNGLFSGLILLLSDLKPKLEAVLLESHIPVVLINSNTKVKNFDTIALDNYEGSYKMTKYLITGKKYSRLCYITGPQKNDDSFLRKEGFIDACKEYGVSFTIEQGDFTKESGYKGCKKQLKSKNKPQVFVAANDMMAIGCYDFMRESGLRIPSDIGVVGFDDIFVAQYLTPPLTTIRVHIEEIGKSAADILIKRIKKEIMPAKLSIKASSELIIRDSC